MGVKNFSYINKMKFITISFIFAAGVNSAPTWLDNLIGYEETPDNKYNGYEQAPYTVIKNTTDYEVRQYPELKYVCTDSVTYPYSPSQSANSVDASWDFFRYFEFVASQRAEKSEQSKNFWKLFRYIQGENKKNQKHVFLHSAIVPEQPSRTHKPKCQDLLLRRNCNC